VGTWAVGNQDRKLWSHTSSNTAYCEIPHKEGSIKVTYYNSWSFRPCILSDRRNQRNCKLLRKPVHLTRIVWHRPWTTGGGSSPSSADYRRRKSLSYISTMRRLKRNTFPKIRKGLQYWWYWWCLKHLPRRSLVHITHLFNYCRRLCQIPGILEGSEIITLPKPIRTRNFPQNLRPISLRSTNYENTS
jgi:hypothetical protein